MCEKSFGVLWLLTSAYQFVSSCCSQGSARIVRLLSTYWLGLSLDCHPRFGLHEEALFSESGLGFPVKSSKPDKMIVICGFLIVKQSGSCHLTGYRGCLVAESRDCQITGC